jgi:hypothetical protein
MTREEFDGITSVLVLAATMLEGLDLSGYVAAISRDDALGPIIDATAWQSRSKATPLLEGLGSKALAFRNTFQSAQRRAVAMFPELATPDTQRIAGGP